MFLGVVQSLTIKGMSRATELPGGRNSLTQNHKGKNSMNKTGALYMIMSLLLVSPVTGEATSFLQDEAGISASINVSGANLALAELAFKTIEKKSDAYIVGSVAIDGYDERHDVHVYVSSSGHMVAYYLKSAPPSMIVDWVNYAGGQMTLAGCKLEDALVKVCNAMFLTLPTVTYFDFRYPNAQQIQIITDEVANNTETFNINIPTNHFVLSSSWSHGIKDTNTTAGTTTSSNIKIDGTQLNSGSNGSASWSVYEGEINESLLSKGVFHEVSIYCNQYGKSYVAIVLLYIATP
jgi:hypothetical protein